MVLSIRIKHAPDVTVQGPHDADARVSRVARRAPYFPSYSHALVKPAWSVGRTSATGAASRLHTGDIGLVASRREPVLVTGSVAARPAFNHTMVLELTQPRDQDGPGNQRHAAMDVVEGVHASHHFAHDERSPPGGEDL